MKNAVLLFLFVILAASVGSAQSQQQNDIEKERRLAANAAFDDRVGKLRNAGKEIYVRDRYKNTRIYQDDILPLYRDLEKDEAILLAPDAADAEKFAEYVDGKDRGLTKLMADKGCDVGHGLVVAKDHCAVYRMPGAGSSFSFRRGMYQAKRLADVSFTGDSFDTKGQWKHGILMSLGDVPLDELSEKSGELATLIGFSVEMDVPTAAKFAALLDQGIPDGEIVYRDSHPAVLDTTYVVRSIAYRGEFWQSVKEIVYDELEFDERRDVIVAFRVVRLKPGESATIVWKTISNNKAPKLK